MSLVETETRGDAIWLWLNRLERHNALVPALVSDLRSALAYASAAEPVALVLSGRGSSFSTGGDIGGFMDHAGSAEELHAYTEELVGSLHETILDLLAFPAPVLAAVNGPVTGGSAGLMLAADMVAMSETAFVQPYYNQVGFGPDGGWTALLPERIGTSRALAIQYRNTRIGAADAVALGLAECRVPGADLAATIEGWVADFAKGFAQTHRATRQSVWDERRRNGVRERLDQEKTRFLDLVSRQSTLDGMKEFTRKWA
ncbi:Enoyl-CoA hydratase/isomerase [Stappia aggregata IAM 12614]|uniref:Enoyl-CoA hydratase/isomerase n=1 Tax=Roseibium aggregatum (strain ATCC 25650 / DSM 13394 / JCM 20685 / NBRC 16684 / NCIMB 2208 / IAM 12614 / B1) TaxID=384765 RepID=A0NMZ8_ROSAI|nr:enoyl-CoA hydratase/isomerase family protein [Roseibium aggregatum]EAV45529.1 Enoyl-CoA hydratase/isomerase [Stappia aggregata IAM 12614] [Roseibium aggregatum IAM 12614]